jgi:hypothetical protein
MNTPAPTTLHVALASLLALAAGACAGKQPPPAPEPQYLTVDVSHRDPNVSVACQDADGSTKPASSKDGIIKCPLKSVDGRLLGGAQLTCKDGTAPVVEKNGNTGTLRCKPKAP